jgi:hypothetical protein
MATNWQTMESAPRTIYNQQLEKGDEFMVAYNGNWEPLCKIEDGVLCYWGHAMYEAEMEWIPFDVSLDDPKLRWAPQPELPVF